MQKFTRSALALLLLFFSQFATANDTSEQLYYYKLNIQNANEWLNGYIEPDLVSTKAAAAVKESQPEACIDLRKLMLMNYRAQDGIMFNGDIAILFNSRMTDETKSAIVARVCQDARGPGVCSVRFDEEVYDVNELIINNHPPIVQNDFQKPPTSHSLRGMPMLPKFSSACDTGEYEDSFEFAASTPEARSYLSDLNVVIQELGIISLAKPDGSRLFDFGHPRSRRK